MFFFSITWIFRPKQTIGPKKHNCWFCDFTSLSDGRRTNIFSPISFFFFLSLSLFLHLYAKIGKKKRTFWFLVHVHLWGFDIHCEKIPRNTTIQICNSLHNELLSWNSIYFPFRKSIRIVEIMNDRAHTQRKRKGTHSLFDTQKSMRHSKNRHFSFSFIRQLSIHELPRYSFCLLLSLLLNVYFDVT